MYREIEVQVKGGKWHSSKWLGGWRRAKTVMDQKAEGPKGKSEEFWVLTRQEFGVN